MTESDDLRQLVSVYFAQQGVSATNQPDWQAIIVNAPQVEVHHSFQQSPGLLMINIMLKSHSRPSLVAANSVEISEVSFVRLV